MTNKFKKAEMSAEILGDLYERLEEKKRNLLMRYDKVGVSDIQARDWRTHELKWEDEEKTIPVYEDKYDYVPIDESELDAEDKLRSTVIDEIMVKLEKLI